MVQLVFADPTGNGAGRMVEGPLFPLTVVSVIIPPRNDGSRIAETVRSVTSQSHDGLKIEVIVMDDRSADNTAEEASEVGAHIIRTGKNGPFGSPSAARNLGATLSTGDPLILLYADCITGEKQLWQSEFRWEGHRMYFEPKAMALHYNHPGFGNLLRRNYRWEYTAIESKSKTGAARIAWLYCYPLLLIAATPLIVVAHTVYLLACWVREGWFEPMIVLPVILLSRFAYTLGMSVGGIQWIRHRHMPIPGKRSRPRWS